jgi:hypothetical protein
VWEDGGGNPSSYPMASAIAPGEAAGALPRTCFPLQSRSSARR